MVWVCVWAGVALGQHLVIGRLLVRFPTIPWYACQSVLGQDTEAQTAPDVLVGSLHGSRHHQCVNVCMNYCKSLWTKASDKCSKCICNVNVNVSWLQANISWLIC